MIAAGNNPSGISPSLIITQPTVFNHILGSKPAQVAHNPVVTQSPFAVSPEMLTLVSPTGMPLTASPSARPDATLTSQSPDHLVHQGLGALTSDVDQAGAHFTQARAALLQSGAPGTAAHFQTATYGEVLWGKVTGKTFDALDRIKMDAAASDTARRNERFMRAVAYFKTGEVNTAISALSEITDIDAPADHVTVLALASQADAYLSLGSRLSQKERESYFANARRVLIHELPQAVEAWTRSDEAVALWRGEKVAGFELKDMLELKESLSAFYYQAANAFKDFSYHATAIEVAKVLAETFDSTYGAKKLLEEDRLGEIDFSDLNIQPDDHALDIAKKVMRALGRFWTARPPHSNPLSAYVEDGEVVDQVSEDRRDRLVAAASEFLAQANMPTNKAFWKTATVGGLLGMTSALIAGGGNISFETAMQMMAVGSTTLVGLKKTQIALDSEEVRQTYRVGYTDKTAFDTFKLGTGQFLKMATSYAFFGGILPGVQGLPDLLLASAGEYAGRIHGIGSGLGGLFYSTTHYGGEMAQFISQYGFSEGMEKFWAWWTSVSHFGSSLNNVGKFWDKTLTYMFTQMPDDIMMGIIKMGSDPISAETVFNLYKGVVGLYAFSIMVRPQIRTALLRQFPRGLQMAEMGMLAGAYFLAYDIGIATGVEPGEAMKMGFLGMLTQGRHHLMSGGRRHNVDWAAVMRATLIPFLYAGTGAQMQADMPAETLTDHFANSMGIQVGLYPIGFIHGMLAGLSLKRQAQVKFWRSWSVESIGNIGRLQLGWATFAGTLWSMAAQQLFLSPAMSRSWQEASGTPSQRTAFLRWLLVPGDMDLKAKPNGKEEAAGVAEGVQMDADVREVIATARKVEQSATIAGTRWDFWNFLAGQTAFERLPIFTAFYWGWKQKDTPFPTRPEDMFYRRAVFRILNSEKTSEDEMSRYLKMLNIMARDMDPVRRSIRHNFLLTTWAARRGPNGKAVRAFFEENDWMFEFYGIDRDVTPPKKSSGWRADRWFKKHLKGSTVTASGKIERYAKVN